MDGACGTHEERRSSYRVLVVKPEGKRLLERPGHRGGDNIKIHLKEMGWRARTGLT